MNHLGDTNKMVSDVATKDYVDKLIEAQEVTLQALASAPITIGEDDPCDGSDESPQSLMHITVLRLDQAHKAALREVDEYRTAIMHLEERIKRLEEALDLVIPNCSWVHHSKKHQHKCGEPCPVVALIEKSKEAKL